MWVLVFITLSSDLIILDAWKSPYVFKSYQECSEMAAETKRLAPKEKFYTVCLEVNK